MKTAIYSRKSKFTGKGESIENQIVLCRDYIQRLFPEATESDIFVYEDEGFSAKNLDRPQFRLMMQHARKEHFDNTAFICIKEQFDTSTPMGRAMMNIAAVFAQLECDTIAKRVQDNLILPTRTGCRLSGVTPLGFTGEYSGDQGQRGQRGRTVHPSIPPQTAS